MKFNRKKNAVIRTAIPVIIISALVFTGDSCKNKSTQDKQHNISREDVQEEVAEAVDTTLAYLSEEQKDLVKTYESQVEKAEEQIGKMKEKIDSAESIVKQNYQQKVQLLESQVAFVKLNISDLENSSKEAWKDLSAGLDSALVDLNQAIQEARNEFQDS